MVAGVRPSIGQRQGERGVGHQRIDHKLLVRFEKADCLLRGIAVIGDSADLLALRHVYLRINS